jgi:hypothetical protein
VKLNETEREYKRTDHLAPDPSRRAWTEMQPVLQLVRKGRYDPSPVKERVTRLERDGAYQEEKRAKCLDQQEEPLRRKDGPKADLLQLSYGSKDVVFGLRSQMRCLEDDLLHCNSESGSKLLAGGEEKGRAESRSAPLLMGKCSERVRGPRSPSPDTTPARYRPTAVLDVESLCPVQRAR